VAMNGKIATGLLGLIVAVSIAGCSSDPSTEEASTTSAAATTTSAASTTVPASTTVDSPAPAPAPAPAAEAPDAPPAAEPAAPSDATSGVTGEALYQQTCTQFMTSIDALEQTGISDRATSVEGLRNEMTTAPSWNDVPPSDQNEILRGLDAAGAGQC
jgi:cytochrome c5